ncbi:hypothetical protein [Erwinia tracheiphila]|uniref:hypothetical protein n=1 Tax=Erwinia tracheiphila TaxID=65700 RepID=UPI001F32A662|nr:hypothetical protein [Erwinia tracheiphila]
MKSSYQRIPLPAAHAGICQQMKRDLAIKYHLPENRADYDLFSGENEKTALSKPLIAMKGKQGSEMQYYLAQKKLKQLNTSA